MIFERLFLMPQCMSDQNLKAYLQLIGTLSSFTQWLMESCPEMMPTGTHQIVIFDLTQVCRKTELM